MKIAIIDPTFYHQGKLLKVNRIGYFPLTLPRLASLLPTFCEITLIHEKCQEVAVGENFDLAFFTTMGSNLVRAEELSREFRGRGIKTVVGGYSVKPFLERCMGNFDSVIVGDGEGILSQIVGDFQNGDLKRFYENLGPSLQDLPIPRFDLVPAHIVGDTVPVEASRGCPNFCDFCAISNLYHAKFRKRDSDQVVRDLKVLKGLWGKHLYYFTDANFAADMEHAKNVMAKISPLGIRWLASVDVKSLEDLDFLNMARKSGCASLQVGFETLSDKELGNVSKNFAVGKNYSRLIKNANNRGVPVVALMMVGFDTDTPAVFSRMFRFLQKNRVSLAVIHPVIPIPGTPLYLRLEKENRLFPLGPEDADGLHVHYSLKNFSHDQFIDLYWGLGKRLTSWNSVIKRFLTPGLLLNPIGYLILFCTNLFLANKVMEKRLPPGLYE